MHTQSAADTHFLLSFQASPFLLTFLPPFLALLFPFFVLFFLPLFPHASSLPVVLLKFFLLILYVLLNFISTLPVYPFIFFCRFLYIPVTQSEQSGLVKSRLREKLPVWV